MDNTNIVKNNGKKKISVTTWVILGLATAAFVLALVLLCINQFGSKKVNFVSSTYPYSMVYDSQAYQYVRQKLDSAESYVERFELKNDEMNCYIGVYGIDETVNLEEALEAFESDGSYDFTVEENSTYGAENYKATKISYTDTSEDIPLQAAYYYDLKHGIMVAACSIEGHEEEITQMLDSFRITE